MDKLNPIVSVILALIIGYISWSLNNIYNDQKQINKILFEKINTAREEQNKANMDYEKRLTLVEWQIKSKNGRFQ